MKTRLINKNFKDVCYYIDGWIKEEEDERDKIKT